MFRMNALKGRWVWLVLWLLLAPSCGGDRVAPPAPTPTPTPSTLPPVPPPPTNRWSLAGRVVDVVTGVPVAGATLESPGFPSATTNASGEYAIESTTAPAGPQSVVTVRAPGFFARDVAVTWSVRERVGVDLSIIRDAPPFDLEFYRQLVRNATVTPDELEPLVRWVTPPRFYVQTVEEGTTQPVPPEVVDLVRDWLALSVQMWTGWSAPVIESGPEPRSPQLGWIRVVFIRTDERICGRAFVGRNPGKITLTLDVCDCGSRKVPPSTVLHEVGHALGFWHVDDRQSAMFPIDPGGCGRGELSDDETLHAAIAYQRPVGSVDIDHDVAPPEAAPLGVRSDREVID